MTCHGPDDGRGAEPRRRTALTLAVVFVAAALAGAVIMYGGFGIGRSEQVIVRAGCTIIWPVEAFGETWRRAEQGGVPMDGPHAVRGRIRRLSWSTARFTADVGWEVRLRKSDGPAWAPVDCPSIEG